jgi:hypothetical protein
VVPHLPFLSTSSNTHYHLCPSHNKGINSSRHLLPWLISRVLRRGLYLPLSWQSVNASDKVIRTSSLLFGRATNPRLSDPKISVPYLGRLQSRTSSTLIRLVDKLLGSLSFDQSPYQVCRTLVSIPCTPCCSTRGETLPTSRIRLCLSMFKANIGPFGPNPLRRTYLETGDRVKLTHNFSRLVHNNLWVCYIRYLYQNASSSKYSSSVNRLTSHGPGNQLSRRTHCLTCSFAGTCRCQTACCHERE